MSTRKAIVGRWGEQVAERFLQTHGYNILARNARTPYGELDLVAQSGEEIVFVEVKTRTSMAFGLPEEAVTPQKRAHILDAAQYFLQMNFERECDWRVDVIAIQGSPGEANPQIEWFENAIV